MKLIIFVQYLKTLIELENGGEYFIIQGTKNGLRNRVAKANIERH